MERLPRGRDREAVNQLCLGVIPLLAPPPCHVPHLFAGHGGIEDNWRESRSPLLGQGGVAAPIKKMPRSLLSGRRRGGWFKPPIIEVDEPLFLVSPYRAHIRSAHARPRLQRNGTIT